MACHAAQANLLPVDSQFTVKRSNVTEIVTACRIKGIEVWLLAFGGIKKKTWKRMHITSEQNCSSRHRP